MKYQTLTISLAAALLAATTTPSHAGLSLGGHASGGGGLSVGVPQVGVQTHDAVDVNTGAASVATDDNLNAAGGLSTTDAVRTRDEVRVQDNVKTTTDVEGNVTSRTSTTTTSHTRKHRHVKVPADSQTIIRDRETGLENRVDAGAAAGGHAATTLNADTAVQGSLKGGVDADAAAHATTGLNQ